MLLGEEECKYCLDHHGYLFRPCACTSKVHETCLNRWRCSGINDQVFWKCSECNTCFQFEESSPIDYSWVKQQTRRLWVGHIIFLIFMTLSIIVMSSFLLSLIDVHRHLVKWIDLPPLPTYLVLGTFFVVVVSSIVGFIKGFFYSSHQYGVGWDDMPMGNNECMCFVMSCFCLFYGLALFFVVIVKALQDYHQKKRQAFRDTALQSFYKVIPYEKIN